MHPPPPQPDSAPLAGTSNNPLDRSTSSTLRNPNALFFPVINHGSAPPAPISGSLDLLTLFNVSSMYDRFVKPYLKPLDQPPSILTTHPSLPGPSNPDLKGKGKADPGSASMPSETLAPKRLKMEKSYGHFVADVGGRNSIKKDHQLQTWLSDPNFQESSIPNFLQPFPSETLAHAFSLQAGTLPGFDSSVWIAEEGGPKRKRKKRKQGELANVPMEPTGQPTSLRTDQLATNGIANPHGLLVANRPDGLVSGGGGGAQMNSAHAVLVREEEHRKKKRTKFSSSVSASSGAASNGHQVAVQL